MIGVRSGAVAHLLHGDVVEPPFRIGNAGDMIILLTVGLV